MANKTRVGEVYESNKCGSMTIVAYRGVCDVDVEFGDGTVITNRRMGSITAGGVKNPMHPSVYNKGYIGIGNYNTTTSCGGTSLYSRWIGMFGRCYSETCLTRFPTYAGCSVDPIWHDFQVFAEWFENNWYNCEEQLHLDKDLKVPGNKVYAPDTCLILPHSLNSLFLDNEAVRGELPIGSHHDKERGGFCSSMSVNGKKKHLGRHDSPEKAHGAWLTAKEKYVLNVVGKWEWLVPNSVIQAVLNKMDSLKGQAVA